MRDAEEYYPLLERLVGHMGSTRGAGAVLGVAHSTLRYRRSHPASVRREHIFAVRFILMRIER